MERRIFWGIVITVVGAIIWLGNLGYLVFKWDRDWPLFLILFGIYLVLKGASYSRRRSTVASRKTDKPIDEKKIKEIIDKVSKGELSAEEAAKLLKS